MKPILICCEVDFPKVLRVKEEFYGADCCEMFVKYLTNLVGLVAGKIYVYAHNGGRFDHLFLQEYLMYRFSQSYQLVGDVTCIKQASIYDGRIVFRDSCLLIPGRLESLAEDFGVQGKNDFKAAEITEEKLANPEYKKQMIEYCH